MSEKIVQLNEEVIKGQLKELVRGSVEETLIGTKRWAAIAEEYSDATELSKGMLNACVALMDDTVLNLCLGEHRGRGCGQNLGLCR